jgi:hypothetical protein
MKIVLVVLLVLVVFIICRNYPTRKKFGLKEKEKEK